MIVAARGSSSATSIPRMDKDVRRKCGKVRRALFHLLLIVGDDYNRVVLDPIEGEPDSDYVNASYVDSILKPNAYIVTQGPMENTVTEFWRMVWQEKACCIVMLTKTFDFIRVMCVQYWPASKDKDEEYGGIGVSVMKEEELANFHIRTIRLYKKNDNDVSVLLSLYRTNCVRINNDDFELYNDNFSTLHER
ncbi:receptor-type tyrosine-protein phosphatase kappa-like [Frieseomelitta varia]|uniref:receptor-type tyrosine-protein phosphatase kappa-like n=1 Tax=Frieseomelitta varia TaxID=561572 RepID=UPI001CB68CA9|nr:receptor-type tyrosine-protein phosphatase kappa-like [Frieseomelitta varia]